MYTHTYTHIYTVCLGFGALNFAGVMLSTGFCSVGKVIDRWLRAFVQYGGL